MIRGEISFSGIFCILLFGIGLANAFCLSTFQAIRHMWQHFRIDPMLGFVLYAVPDIFVNGTVYHHKEPMQWDRSLSSKSSHLFLLLEENLCLTNKVAMTRNATFYRAWHSCVLREVVQGSVLALTRIRFEQSSLTLQAKEVRKLVWDLLTEFAQQFGSKNVHYYGGIVSVEGAASTRALSAGMLLGLGLLTACRFLQLTGI
ncbi:hypothetical protein P879_00723 [Paragonimus westermani]|uniref:Uncharacterized protein n=1 Tax=Paragonimus westermani TaxID=34504 RepID=A0A8T0DIU5_9TREM|nr:hypothetical protein P879_00723 [Paragonimus westermani]